MDFLDEPMGRLNYFLDRNAPSCFPGRSILWILITSPPKRPIGRPWSIGRKDTVPPFSEAHQRRAVAVHKLHFSYSVSEKVPHLCRKANGRGISLEHTAKPFAESQSYILQSFLTGGRIGRPILSISRPARRFNLGSPTIWF